MSGRFELEVSDRYPSLVLTEDPDGVALPDQLVRAHEKATAALIVAEEAIARWTKYAAPSSCAGIRPLIERLEPAVRKSPPGVVD